MNTIRGDQELAELRSDLDDMLTVAEGDGIEAAKSHKIRTLMASNRKLREGRDSFRDKATSAEREMHARELHHFEEEQKSARLEAAIREALDVAPGLGDTVWRAADRMIGVLRRALDETKEQS